MVVTVIPGLSFDINIAVMGETCDETASCEEPLVDNEPSGLTDQDSDDDEEHEEVETD